VDWQSLPLLAHRTKVALAEYACLMSAHGIIAVFLLLH
jgi:hypothetical protein